MNECDLKQPRKTDVELNVVQMIRNGSGGPQDGRSESRSLQACINKCTRACKPMLRVNGITYECHNASVHVHFNHLM